MLFFRLKHINITAKLESAIAYLTMVTMGHTEFFGKQQVQVPKLHLSRKELCHFALASSRHEVEVAFTGNPLTLEKWDIGRLNWEKIEPSQWKTSSGTGKVYRHPPARQS